MTSPAAVLAPLRRGPRDQVPAAVVHSKTPLDDVEVELIATLVSTLTAPGMAAIRQRVRRGELTLCIDGDEVAWMETEAGKDADAMKGGRP